MQLQYIYFRLVFYVFSCVHDCIFLSNSVGHDSLSSRLIWSVRVWLCTQFGGLMSSLGSRKPSFFFFDEENQNELTSILIKQSSKQLWDISSTYWPMLFVFMKISLKRSCIDTYVVFIQIVISICLDLAVRAKNCRFYLVKRQQSGG